MSEEESFKVTDRRGRAPDADPPGPDESSSRSAAAPADVVPSAAPGRARARRQSGGPDLQGIFVMFASSALIHLGVAADPATGERRVDLDHARDAIDALLLLRDKTSGNRTDEESRFLEQIVYDLQLRYVRIAEPA